MPVVRFDTRGGPVLCAVCPWCGHVHLPSDSAAGIAAFAAKRGRLSDHEARDPVVRAAVCAALGHTPSAALPLTAANFTPFPAKTCRAIEFLPPGMGFADPAVGHLLAKELPLWRPAGVASPTDDQLWPQCPLCRRIIGKARLETLLYHILERLPGIARLPLAPAWRHLCIIGGHGAFPAAPDGAARAGPAAPPAAAAAVPGGAAAAPPSTKPGGWPGTPPHRACPPRPCRYPRP